MARNKISKVLLASTALTCATFIIPVQSHAGPEDGTVSGGSATISQNGSTTSIHQSSNRAIIDWRSFDVEANETVRFYQPGASSITLNRINDSKASLINGHVEANGQIMLLNQNGIVFGAGSRVDVAGLVASTGRIDDAAFMSGATTLNIAPGGRIDAKIINNGTISARDAGLVGLVAPTVENNGVITARLGKVTLAGAERATLDLAGDGLISIDVDDEFNGKVINTGSITADGGTITLTATRARDAVESSLINTGELRANTVGIRNGRIILSAGGNRAGNSNRGQSVKAAVKQAGTLQAKSGQVEILGDSIQLTETSRIDVSATTGNGGSVHIGGSYQGGSDRPTATWVTADRGSLIQSNGDIGGEGGSIILWADRLMTFRGRIEAEGGEEGGDGGFVEVSGKNRLVFDGEVSTRALKGKDGVLLLDPTNIEITAGPDQSVTSSAPFEPDADDATSHLSVTTLLNALALGNVIVQTRATGSQNGDITVSAALSWASGNTLTLDAHHDIIVNQAISGGGLTLSAGNDVALNANIGGSGILTIQSQSAGGTLGVGTGAAGTLHLSTTDLSHITDGWSRIVLGRSDGSGVMQLAAHSWTDNVELRSGTGIISVNGTQNFGGNNLTIHTDANLQLGATLSGSGTLLIGGQSASSAFGIGTGQSGDIQLDDAELAFIQNGWSNLLFGTGGALNIGAASWSDNVTFSSSTGIISITGAQNLGANTLTIKSDTDIAINAALSGTGNVIITSNTSAGVIGVGAAQTGSIQIDAAEIANIGSGWTAIQIGDAGVGGINLGALTWAGNLILEAGSGIININGAQDMGGGNLTIRSLSDIAVNAALTGNGTLTVQSATTSGTMGIGDSQTGALTLSTAEVALLTNTWSNIILGRTDGTGAINVGALTWNDALTIQSGTGVITINGAQSMGANALTVRTDGDIALNAALTGTTTLNIVQASAGTTMGLGNSQTGSLNLTTTEIGNITNGWASLVFGRTDGTGAINIGALTWNDNLTLQSGSGVINVNGTQTMGANNLTVTTDADIVLTGNLTGSGTLTIAQAAAGTTMGLGNSATGAVNLTATEVGRITDGWGNRIFGRTDGTGAINITANTWTDNLTLRSHTGVITISGAQALGANNLTVTTNADMAISAAVTSTGTLTISGQSTSTSMGLGDSQAGTINLTAAEIGFLTNTWGSIVLGRTDGSGNINIGALSWLDPLTLRNGTGNISINGAQTYAANNVAITTDGGLNIGSTMTGTGTLTLSGQTASTTMGFGTGQTGTIQLTDTEVANMQGSWAGITLGRTDGTGAINVGALTWNDILTLRSASGAININGTQTMGANNLTIQTDSNLALSVGANLTGTGTLTITTQNNGTTMGLGGGAGTLNLTATEISQITNGWASLVFGLTTATGAININALSWNDHLTLRTAAGVITIAGTQNLNGNNLTITTDGNLGLSAGANLTSAGGALNISSTNVATSMSLGTGQTGTINLNDTEISQISDGWSSITFGNAAGTGTLNVGTSSWNDALHLRTLSGVIGINGTLTMNSANNLTITTDGNMNIAAAGALAGTGQLVIQTNAVATTIGLGNGATGTLNLTDTELGRISNGWSGLTFGQVGGTGAMTVGAMTWNDHVTLLTGSGVLTVSGAQTMGSNNLTLTTNSDVALNANLSGSGTLTIQAAAAATAINIATGAGGLNISTADLSQILNGWGEIIFGNAAGSGAMSVGAYTWQYNTTFRTGAGVITVSGAQVNTGNNMTYETDANMVVSANISGTGILAIRPSAASTIMNIATGSTNLNLTTTELAFIQDGWSRIVFGRTGTTGAVTVGTRTWTDNVQFISGTGAMTVNGATMGSNNLTLTTDSDVSLGGTLTGTGTLIIEGASNATGIGVGTGQTGALSLNATDLTRFGSTWSNIQIGNTSSTAAINIGTNSWANNMTFITNGNVVLNGIQTSSKTSGTSLVFASLAGSFINSTGSATPINPGSGTARYLIYSRSAATDSYGSFTAPASISAQTYFGYGPSAVVETGNRIIYSDGAAKVLYIQIDNKTKVYGDAVPILSWTYIGGLQGGDTLGAAITAAALSASGAAVTDNVGTTLAITGNFTTALGYSVSVTNGTLSVSKAPVTVQASNASREYGDTNPTFMVNYTGLKNGESSTVIDTLATAATTATAASNVGTYAITTSGSSDNNYVFNHTNGTLTVTKATLTITAQDKTREYGDANPALTVSYAGFKNSDTSAVIDTNPSISTTATAASNVGAYGITLSGGTDNNYNFSFVSGTLTVTKATLTATADNKSRAYGDANPALTVSYTGFKNSETSTVIDSLATASTAATPLSNVGSYTISAAGATDGNYNFVYADGSLTVNKAMLTVTADNQTRQYGLANPSLTVSYAGFKNGETFAVLDTAASASTAATVLSNVASYAISVSGASDGNYDFTYVDGSLAVTKAMLTVTADNQTREYGDVNPTLSFSYSGFRNGENSGVLDTGATVSTTATALSNAGSYAITGAGAADNNYDFTYVNGSLAITKATLTATADNQTRAYGDANPALTISYTGFKNSDTSAVLDTAAVATTSATALSNVGSYTINASGGTDNNYNFSYVAGSLAITKATLTATADNQSRTYGDVNPALTVSYTGFKNGENSSVIDTAAAATTSATTLSNAGNYTISASGAADGNYDFVYADGTLTIGKATLTVTADNQTREYGDANPALTVAYSGFRNGENSSVLDTLVTASTSATALSNVGNHTISASGGADTNYDFSYVDGTLVITKAMLTVTADNQTREYGLANPALTASYAGFKNGENSVVIDTLANISTSATTLSNTGNYAIIAAGAADGNYDFSYVDGSLSITKATLAITADNQAREYGLANPALTVSYSGFRNGDTSAVLDTAPAISTSATNASNVGSYGIVLTGGTDNNYDLVLNNGTLTVTKAMLTATADNKTREYGLTNPALTITYTGFRNGQNASVIDTLATASTTATVASNVASYTISASGAADSNYDFTYVDGTLAVTQATLTVTADNKTREYGDANPALTLSYSGFRNADTAADLDLLSTIGTAATALTAAGTHAITLSGGSDTNYNIVLTNGTLTISKATLTVTAGNASREYGDANPGFSATYTGFKNGETNTVIDTLATLATTAGAASNVGNYTIAASGAFDDNYNFAYVNGTLAVTKALVTVTVNAATREYGLANPAFTATYAGLKNGEIASVINLAPTFSTTATTTSGIGNYVVTASGASDNNYDFSFVNGNLSITPASLTIVVNRQIRLVGAANPALTYGISGLRAGDTALVISGLVLSTPADPLSPAGSYAITASGASAANYTISYAQNVIDVVEQLPVTNPTLPGTVSASLSDPLSDHVGFNYDPTYNVYNRPDFMTSAIIGEQGERREDGLHPSYVRIYYYSNPFEDETAEPLMFIDPQLYRYENGAGGLRL